jgi:hypothetical protein
MSSTLICQINTVIPAPRLFKAAIVDWHNLAQKIAADKVVSAVTIKGDGGVGSVRQLNFGPGKFCSFTQSEKRSNQFVMIKEDMINDY